MDRIKTQGQHESTSVFSPLLRMARNRIAMLSLAGAAALPMALQACKVSLNFNLNTPEGARAAGVDKNGFRIITIPEIGVGIDLKKAEKKDQTRIEGLMHISASSPLHTASDGIREYEIPEEDRPWKQMVVEPSGRVILKMEGNQIAMVFVCKGLTNEQSISCVGDEEDPKKLDAEIARVQAEYDKKRSEDAKDAGADGGEAGGADAANTDAGTKTTTTTPTDSGAGDSKENGDAGSTDAGTDAPAEAGPQEAAVDKQTFLSRVSQKTT